MNYSRKRVIFFFFHTLVNLNIQSDQRALKEISSEMSFLLSRHNVKMFCCEALLDVNYMLVNGIIIVLFCLW